MDLVEFQTCAETSTSPYVGTMVDTPHNDFPPDRSISTPTSQKRRSLDLVVGDLFILSIRIAEKEFERLSAQWRSEINRISSADEELFVQSPAYQQIIGLGWGVVPVLLQELQKAEQRHIEPEPWFWALAAITKENPVPLASRGNLRETTNAWLRWGFENRQLLE